MFRPPISKLPIQVYIQTIYVRNDKYKLYPNKQTTLSNNLITTQQQLNTKSMG